jgi:hypothetical protein
MKVKAKSNICSFLLPMFPVALLILMYWDPLITGQRLFHPDWAPYFEKGYGQGFWRMFVEIGRAPGFMSFMWGLLPDRLFHALFYPVITFSIWSVLYVFFRKRDLPRAAAMAGALAGAFAGYYLTLVSAGHRNVYEAVLSSVIVLFCIDGVVQGGGIWYGIAAALATAFTLGSQPDVLGIIGLFLVVYAIAACWWNRKEIAAKKGRFALTLIVAGIVFIATVLPAARKIYTSTLPGREALIARSAGVDEGGGEAVSAAQRWEFTTNWSLPLADTPELILPLFFGAETTDQSAPFWGELGRSLNWEPGRPGFRNFRQHTIYMGILQVLLAIFACGCVLSKRCRQGLFQSDDERRQVIFWGICAIIALLLSLGRYTTFYRLFYTLPIASSIRAPIKFLHVVNLAAAILTAYGVNFLLRARAERNEQREMREIAVKAAKWLAVGSGGLAVFLVLVALVAQGASASIAACWSQMGFDASLHPAMRRHMFMALWRSSMLAAGFAGCIYVFICRRQVPVWSATALGMILCGAIGLDMVVTARRFVHTADLSVHESQNAIVDDIRGDVAPRLFDMLTSRQPHDPLRVNLRSYYSGAVRLLDDELPNDGALLVAVGNNFGRLVRLLRVAGTEYVVGPREKLVPWLHSGAFTLVGEYDFANQIIRTGQGRRGHILLLQVQQALPRAAWFPSARFVDEKGMTDAIFAPSFDPQREVLVAGDGAGRGTMGSASGAMYRPASISEWSRWRVVVEEVPAGGGILLLNDPFHKHWAAYADGEPIDIKQANGAMMAVILPDGVAEIVFLRRPGWAFLWISTVPAAALFSLLFLHISFWAKSHVSWRE